MKSIVFSATGYLAVQVILSATTSSHLKTECRRRSPFFGFSQFIR